MVLLQTKSCHVETAQCRGGSPGAGIGGPGMEVSSPLTGRTWARHFLGPHQCYQDLSSQCYGAFTMPHCSPLSVK